MARSAMILHEGNPGSRELRLSRVLDFFGVPFEEADVTGIGNKSGVDSECAIFGSARAIASVQKQFEAATAPAFRPAAYYVYADDDSEACAEALRTLSGDSSLFVGEAPSEQVNLRVTDEFSEVVGPMAGLRFALQMRKSDRLLTGGWLTGKSKVASVISAGDAAVLARFQLNGTFAYFCASSEIVDIERTIDEGVYDVKRHFCSAVPLVIFIRATFRGAAWAPQELGACLIIDDPLLKPVYGFCDFLRLRELMQEHKFTTNIAFIPWNWRRTSPKAAKLFSDGSGQFSVSIHGCDHTGGEFGTISPAVLDSKAKLALSRMRGHEARTGIPTDSIMVFPQGVFSSESPRFLKENGFLAAINTELVPVDSQNARTKIRDVWDVAIMTHGDFPIFTRRYAHHGLENFAFDLLLGKPCFIVTHHEFFKDDGIALVDLVEKINSLNCTIRWAPLGEVVRGACRRRIIGTDMEEVEMYANELLVTNPSDRPVQLAIRKRASADDRISGIKSNGEPLAWSLDAQRLTFREQISARSDKLFRVDYGQRSRTDKLHRTLRLELSVALRRVLSEFRDDYVAKNRILSIPAGILKSMLRKAV